MTIAVDLGRKATKQTLHAILNKSENASLQYFIFFEKVLDEKYLLKLNNVFQTSSKLFAETPPICLVYMTKIHPRCKFTPYEYICTGDANYAYNEVLPLRSVGYGRQWISEGLDCVIFLFKFVT